MLIVIDIRHETHSWSHELTTGRWLSLTFLLRRRKHHKYRVKPRVRVRRSSARTIIQLDSRQEGGNDQKVDPKEIWSKKKCHKYAMFKVIIPTLIL